MTKKHHRALIGGTAVWLTMSGFALADVTANEVWDSWKGYAESIGQTITTGSESNSGGTLMLRDVKVGFVLPEGEVSGTLELLELKELGDGSVAITMSEDYPFAVSVNPPDGEELDLTLMLRQTGMAMVASGTKDAISYDYTASQLSMDVDKLFVGGEDIAPKIGFKFSDLGGKYAMSEGELRQIDSAFTAAQMIMDIDFKDPETGADMVMSGTIDNISSSSKAALPMEIDLEDPAWIFGDEFSATGGFTSGESKYTMTMGDGTETVLASGSSAATSLTFSLQDSVIGYGGGATDTRMQISGSQIPFPELKLGMAESEFDLKMPMSQTDEPTDFGLLTKIVGLYVGDEIWSMFDPGQILPRDPATAVLDVSGKLKWLMDISNPEAIENAGDASPAELHALSINDITLSVAGASIEGKGDFTFDSTDTTTFDGMPAPTGEVDFKIVGANGLIDKLIQMGLLPDDQAMVGRMMLGMFARPGDGVDTLTSKIEVKGDGSVFANGQQLQ